MAKEIELDFDLIKEHEVLKGFYYPPFITQPQIVVNENGVVKDAIRYSKRNINVTSKGYLVTHIKVNEKNINFSLHRLVALTFINRPERHQNVPHSDLQVNHIDGNKCNNIKTNLEWVDSFENMLHARENGLFSNDKAVLVKDTLTNQITKIRSISECARLYLLETVALGKHLRSSVAARIKVDNLLFKFDDGSDWPNLLSSLEGREWLGFTREIVAYNLKTKVAYLTNTLEAACKFIGYELNIIKNHRARKGSLQPYEDWILCHLEDFHELTKE